MCLILFARKSHPKYKLILLANRDEFYDRPAQPLNFWSDAPEILAGRDLKGNGTWLGIDRKGRLAAITNYRDPANLKPNAPSRGLLVSNYLKGRQTPQTYLKNLLKSSSEYNGFNLLVGDQDKLFYLSNYQSEIIKITSGIHGLSNHLLNTPWPKVSYGKEQLERLITQSPEVNTEDFFELLSNRMTPIDSQLPDTGVGIVWERMLAPMFICSPAYGTRCSTIILIEHSGRIHIQERTFSPESQQSWNTSTKTFTIDP